MDVLVQIEEGAQVSSPVTILDKTFSAPASKLRNNLEQTVFPWTP